MPNFIRSILSCLFAVLFFIGCNTSNTVLQDFGLQERSEDYVSGEDRTMKSMRTVGATELKRLNTANQRGEIKYQSDGDLNGKFYKEVKRYTKAYPISAHTQSRTGNRKETGFRGTIEYGYEIYEGPRFSNRTKAEASDAIIPSGQRGREAYRYTFSSGGVWDGGKGKLASR